MYTDDLQKAIKAKIFELELAIDFGKPHTDILKVYKELKELRYRLMQVELTSLSTENSP